jgi:hypothetical protein
MAVGLVAATHQSTHVARRGRINLIVGFVYAAVAIYCLCYECSGVQTAASSARFGSLQVVHRERVSKTLIALRFEIRQDGDSPIDGWPLSSAKAALAQESLDAVAVDLLWNITVRPFRGAFPHRFCFGNLVRIVHPPMPFCTLDDDVAGMILHPHEGHSIRIGLSATPCEANYIQTAARHR